MKKITLFSLLFSMMWFAGLASACTTPAVLDTNGAFICPIHWCNFDGQLLIDGSNYPNVPIINYTLQVQNFDNNPETVFLSPSSNLLNYISPATVVVPGLSTQNISMMVWVYGQNVAGTIDIGANCADGPLIVPLSIRTQVNGKQIMSPPGPMQNVSSGSFSTTTSTTTTSATTSISNLNQTVLINSQGCSFSQITCPSQFSYCTYQFVGPYSRTGPVNCDSSNQMTNPGVLQPESSLCPPYDSNFGFSFKTNCQLNGITVLTNSSTSTSTTSSSTSTSDTTTAQTTTTTSQSPITPVLDSFGCQFGQVSCPSNFQYCTYQFSKSTGPLQTVSCDSSIILQNPGSIPAGSSICPDYDNSKGFSRLVRCQVFGYSGNSSTSTTSTSPTSSSSTTTTTTTTSTTASSSGTVLMSKFSCNFPQISCPSNFAYCIYKFTGKIPISSVRCDTYLAKQNPGVLNSGESLCPPYDTNGYSSSVNCTLVGYGSSGNSLSSPGNFSNMLDNISSLLQSFLSASVNVPNLL